MRTLLFVGLLIFSIRGAVVPPLMQIMPPPQVPVPTHAAMTAEKFHALSANAAAQVQHALRGYLHTQYHQLADSLAKTDARHQARIQSWGQVVFTIGQWLSLLVLIVPLLRWRHHRGRRVVLVVTAVFGAGLFALCMFVLGGLFGTLNDMSHNVAAELDPKRAMLDAGFELMLDDTVPLLIEAKTPWADVVQVTADVDAEDSKASSGLSERLFVNLTALHRYTFEPVAKLYQVWRGWAAAIPLALVIATALLFLLSVRSLLKDLVTLPERAASGEPRALRGAFGKLFGTVWHEVLAILVLLFSVGLLCGALAIAMRQLARPSMRILVAQTEAALQWLSTAEPELNVGVAIGMSSLPVLLLACVSLMALSSVLWMFRARQICRARFHNRIPLRAHNRFWRTSSWALIKLHWIPIIFLTVTAPAIMSLVGTNTPDGAPIRLLGSAIFLTLGMAATFWFFRGHRALRTLWHSTMQTGPAEDVNEENASDDYSNTSVSVSGASTDQTELDRSPRR